MSTLYIIRLVYHLFFIQIEGLQFGRDQLWLAGFRSEGNPPPSQSAGPAWKTSWRIQKWSCWWILLTTETETRRLWGQYWFGSECWLQLQTELKQSDEDSDNQSLRCFIVVKGLSCYNLFFTTGSPCDVLRDCAESHDSCCLFSRQFWWSALLMTMKDQLILMMQLQKRFKRAMKLKSEESSL